MEEKVLSAVNRFSLLSGGEKVTVALSGGADSVSLLFALLRLQKRLNITVSAAHFNHMIRGAEADRDEAFARNSVKSSAFRLLRGGETFRGMLRKTK